MNYKEMTRLELVEGGNVFRQGSYVKLSYEPRDDSGNIVDLTGKDIAVVIWNKKGILYESTATYDEEAKLIRLMIEEKLQHGKYNIEFIATSVADVSYRQIFPSSEYEGLIEIKPSADSMDVVGVQMVTVEQLRIEQQSAQQAFESEVLPRVQTVESQQAQLAADYEAAAGALTEDSEVILARRGEPTLGAFNDKVTAQLAETDEGIISLDAPKIENLVVVDKATAPSMKEIFNLQRYTEQLNSGWYVKSSGITLGDAIEIDGIKLTKVQSNNYYHSLETRTSSGIALQAGKKYLCSAYCITFDKPRFFYHKSDSNGINNAVYADNSLRRFWFVVDGAVSIPWYVQGRSGYNGDTTEYQNNIYVGGFQVEEIPADTKYGIAAIGDSTVQNNAGSNDMMNNTAWLKFAGSILNAKFFNRGIGGNTTQQMIDRWTTDMTPLVAQCKYAILQGGINDIQQGVVFETIKANLQTLHDLAVADGFIPVICTITPCNRQGASEQIRLDLNDWIRTTFSKVLDISEVVVDAIQKNQLKRASGWYGDGVHYEMEAKKAIADYIASRNFWEFRYPKAYQRVVNNGEFGNPFYTGSAFIDSAGTKKIEFLDLGTGSRIKLHEGANSANVQFYSGLLNLENPHGSVQISPKEGSYLDLKEVARVLKEFRVPQVAPASLSDAQLWFDYATKELKFTGGGVTKVVATI